MTVQLKISQWTAKKYDSSVSKEVEEQHEAKDAGRYNKALIEKGRMAAINKEASRLRNFHYENTLPWGDNGDRLLSSENYFHYMTELDKLKNSFELTVKDFIIEYDDLVEASRIRLGRMFRERDYPSRSQVEGKFGVKAVILPVSETDFRVNLGDEELTELKRKAEQELAIRLREAVHESWKRIKEQLVHMRDRLGEKEAIFRNSLFENLKSLCDVLPRLNITGDPHIKAVCEEIKELLASPDEIRKNSELRQQKVIQVEAIIDRYKNFFK